MIAISDREMLPRQTLSSYVIARGNAGCVATAHLALAFWIVLKVCYHNVFVASKNTAPLLQCKTTIPASFSYAIYTLNTHDTRTHDLSQLTHHASLLVLICSSRKILCCVSECLHTKLQIIIMGAQLSGKRRDTLSLSMTI